MKYFPVPDSEHKVTRHSALNPAKAVTMHTSQTSGKNLFKNKE